MRFNRSRLRRLEEADRGGPCPGCKLSPDGYVVYYEGEQPREPKRCQACGRQLESVIRVVYEGEGGYRL